MWDQIYAHPRLRLVMILPFGFTLNLVHILEALCFQDWVIRIENRRAIFCLCFHPIRCPFEPRTSLSAFYPPPKKNKCFVYLLPPAPPLGGTR